MLLMSLCMLAVAVSGFVLGLMYAKSVKKALSDKIDG